MSSPRAIRPSCIPDASALTGFESVLTPALAIYPDVVDANIKVMLRLLDWKANRWRPHIKTAKLERTIRQMMGHGITQFKCATTLELLIACKAGARDVLVAYPCVGSRAERVREIACEFAEVRISVVVENQDQVEQWNGSSIDIYIDVNPGMNRTGVGQCQTREIVDLARKIHTTGRKFRGLHYYDGHHRQANLEERTEAAYAGYTRLLTVIAALRSANTPSPEIITSGTPALPCALTFPGFKAEGIDHCVSPGTIVYNDNTSMSQLPPEWGFQLAVTVFTTVVSHPAPGLITCDAGHKTVSADSGVPNCSVLGHPELEPLHPSEEHMPIRVLNNSAPPRLGQILQLVPRHVCPTVNNFDYALLLRNEEVVEVVPVSARGREVPL